MKAVQSSRDPEIYWGIPIAASVFWAYIYLCAIVILPIRHLPRALESQQQKQRRQFVQMLQDPHLRHLINLKAKEKFGEKGADAHMAQLDSKAAFYLDDTPADKEWKEEAARLQVWNAYVKKMWKKRRFLSFLFLVSGVLLVVDTPHLGRVIDGMMVLTVSYYTTYVMFPESPTEKAKKAKKNAPMATDDDVETPLLQVY